MKTKTKRRIKDTVLCFITSMSFVYWVASLGELVEGSMKALIIFIATTVWLGLFCKANSWEEN